MTRIIAVFANFSCLLSSNPNEYKQTLFFRLLPLNGFHLKPKSVIPIYVLYLSELLLYILFSIDIIIKALITKACLTACINFIRVRFRCFFQGCFSVFTKLITSYLTSKNGKKTERKRKDDLIIFFVGKLR